MNEERDNKLLDKYFANKEDLDTIRDNETLLKWEVLSRANKQGKEIWGKHFTTLKLSKDMGLPYTTTKRCLSLDKATPKSWALMEKKKISAFKLAMICQLKSNGFQDEIVEEVISKGLSTSQIKVFKPKNIQDINEWRHKKAVEQGYSRASSAYRNFLTWIERGNLFMIMPISSVGPTKKKEIIEKLTKLRDKLNAYLKQYG